MLFLVAVAMPTLGWSSHEVMHGNFAHARAALNDTGEHQHAGVDDGVKVQSAASVQIDPSGQCADHGAQGACCGMFCNIAAIPAPDEHAARDLKDEALAVVVLDSVIGPRPTLIERPPRFVSPRFG